MLIKQKAIAKHRFILDYLIEHKVEIVNLIEINGTRLPTRALRKITAHFWCRKLEANLVFQKNNLAGKIHTITEPSKIREDDIVICYGSFADSRFVNINQIQGIKILDQGHFYGDSKRAEIQRKGNFQYYFFEVDLRKYSKLFQKNYRWFSGELIIRPYAYASRFVVKKSFNERKNKAVAMGTLTEYDNPEFVEAYGSKYYQPHRKMILDHADQYPREIDSYISEYKDKRRKEISINDTLAIVTFKNIYNFFLGSRQKEYFSFNMVDKYNEYQMFICPEDVNGSYGIGTIEGMACGCAMIGLNCGIFEDMGMNAGVHYIPYDGTMEDLIEKIHYYQQPEQQKKLEEIARSGCDFIRKNYSEKKVASEYYKKLLEISKSKSKSGD